MLFLLLLPSGAWPGTGAGIHSFLTFDYYLNDSSIAEVGSRYSYVWGTSEAHSPAWRAASPKTVLSHYMPYNRWELTGGRTLEWYQKNHPEWVVYRCDGVTPAYTFNQSTYIPVDISNEEVIAHQLERIDAALPTGTGSRPWADSVAFDNFELTNGPACGTWRRQPGGKLAFVQRWKGEEDPAWAPLVATWTARMADGLHSRGLTMVPNFALPPNRSWDDPIVLAIANATDGVLDEAGFTWAAGYKGKGGKTYDPYISFWRWRNLLMFIRNMLSRGKAYWSVNESGGTIDGCGDGDVGECYARNANISSAVRQYVVASWLMGAGGGASGVDICCTQCYGIASWFDELGAPVGHALEEPIFSRGPTEISSRRYSGALVLVNAYHADEKERGVPIAVPLEPAGTRFTDLTGQTFVGSATVEPQAALVLMPATAAPAT